MPTEIRKRKHLSTAKRAKSSVQTRLDEKSVPIELEPAALPSSWLLLAIFAYRLVNALVTITYFQADEFFQCLEPAHKLAFGYGYITWEWKERLRSAIHPLIYAGGYKLVGLVLPNTAIDSSVVIITSKVIGAIIGALGDFFTYKFAYNFSNGDIYISGISLAVSLSNPFNWYVVTRSFSNNLEMVLTATGLAYWPFFATDSTSLSDSKYRLLTRVSISCIFGITSCIVRPTNAILWITLGVHLVYKNRTTGLYIVGVVAVEAAVILAINTGIDYIYYGELTFPLYNFLEFNVVKNLSIFYGVAPWHFHLLQSVPIMTLTFLPFLLHYFFMLQGYKSILGITSCCVIGVFSAISHKEFRFIYPLQPIFTYGVSKSIAVVKPGTAILGVVLSLNVAISLFFTRINERGAIDVVNYISNESVDIPSFGFLTPCHSTPWQSYLHNPKYENGAGWSLSCEPPLHLSSQTSVDFMQEIKEYRDESDRFFDNPAKFLADNFPPKSYGIGVKGPTGEKYSWPSRIIIFEPMELFMSVELGDKYYECERFFNSYFHWDSRRRSDIIVYCPIEN